MQHAFFVSCCCFARLGSTLNFQKLPSYMHVLWGKYRTCFRSHFFLRHLRYYLFSVACCDSANRCCQYGRALSTLFLYLNHDHEMFFCQLLNSSAVSNHSAAFSHSIYIMKKTKTAVKSRFFQSLQYGKIYQVRKIETPQLKKKKGGLTVMLKGTPVWQ